MTIKNCLFESRDENNLKTGMGLEYNDTFVCVFFIAATADIIAYNIDYSVYPT